MRPVPPRIHVLLASDSPRALVIRRGPSDCVATVLWDRHRDEFQLGQWLKGRIYERRSDISPDGQYAIYFAMNGKWQSESKGSWTAISRVPYLKAIAFLPKGDCWHGGGLWTGKNSYWLNDGHGHSTGLASPAVHRDHDYQPCEYFGGECLGVYYVRLLRDGWRMAGERIHVADWKVKDMFEKSIGKGWVLRKIAHAEHDAPIGKGVYWDEHELVGPAESQTIACPDWEWADLDGDRLVWAAKGKLFAASVAMNGINDMVELHDFNAMQFEAIEAPY